MAKLLVIVGPTASGKSDLAMKLAKQLDGEIICADSRTVYKGLDIGTAKPSKQDREEVHHHLLDVVEPDEPFTVADFKERAERAITDTQKRGKLPIMVGGSGLYIDAVLFNFKFSDPDTAKDPNNSRHLSKDAPRNKSDQRSDALVIGLEIDRTILKERIAKRAEQMVINGFLDEVKRVEADYGSGVKALQAPGYKEYLEHLSGLLSLEETKALFIKNHSNLAKRQMTWFKRNKNIHWLNDPSTYVEDTIKLLNKLH